MQLTEQRLRSCRAVIAETWDGLRQRDALTAIDGDEPPLDGWLDW